jgi:hypothetical protein
MSWVGPRLPNDANAYPSNNAFPSYRCPATPHSNDDPADPAWSRHLHLTRAKFNDPI